MLANIVLAGSKLNGLEIMEYNMFQIRLIEYCFVAKIILLYDAMKLKQFILYKDLFFAQGVLPSLPPISNRSLIYDLLTVTLLECCFEKMTTTATALHCYFELYSILRRCRQNAAG
jgi:hypothetical protein